MNLYVLDDDQKFGFWKLFPWNKAHFFYLLPRLYNPYLKSSPFKEHCFPCKDNSLWYLLNQQSEKYNDFRILTIKKQRLFFSSTYYTNTSVISRNQYLQSSIEILVFELKKCPKSKCRWIGEKSRAFAFLLFVY